MASNVLRCLVYVVLSRQKGIKYGPDTLSAPGNVTGVENKENNRAGGNSNR